MEGAGEGLGEGTWNGGFRAVLWEGALGRGGGERSHVSVSCCGLRADARRGLERQTPVGAARASARRSERGWAAGAAGARGRVPFESGKRLSWFLN